jgi:hypothetical protein
MSEENKGPFFKSVFRTALRLSVNGNGDANDLMAQATAAAYPGLSPQEALWTAGCAQLIDAMEKQRIASMVLDSEWADIAQSDLFGEMIPAHKVPKALLTRSVSEAADYMEERARVSLDNVEEIERHLAQQRDLAHRLCAWRDAVAMVRDAMTERGIDPESVTYEQATKQAASGVSGHEAVSRRAAVEPVREMRADH